MSSSKLEVEGRSSGRMFWNIAHEDLVERHPRVYIIVIILLISLLSALAAYLLIDIANHSSLPPFSKAISQSLLSEGRSFCIPYNDTLSNPTWPHEMALSQNSTCSQTRPSQEIAKSPNGSIESLFPFNLQGSAAVLAAGVGTVADATAHSLGPDGMITRISDQAKAFQESLSRLPSSINSWVSPTLSPLLKSLTDNAREIGDHASGVPLPRANFSLELSSLIAH